MMKMKIQTMSKSIVVLFIMLILISLFIPYRCSDRQYITDTVYHTKVDTIRDTITKTIIKPQIKTVETLKTDTVISCKGDTFELITEAKNYLDTLVMDSDTAIVKTHISGINANLDSLGIVLHKSNLIYTNTIEITKYKKPSRFYVSPQVGIGYGITKKCFDMYFGIGIGVNL